MSICSLFNTGFTIQSETKFTPHYNLGSSTENDKPVSSSKRRREGELDYPLNPVPHVASTDKDMRLLSVCLRKGRSHKTPGVEYRLLITL